MGEIIEFRSTPSAEEYLRSLKHPGFEDEAQLNDAIDKIVALRAPTSNILSLARRSNDEDTENVVGQYDVGGEDIGRFTIFELADKQPPEENLRTHIHEVVGHANSPLREQNSDLYGGEENREEFQLYDVRLAEQSLLSNKYLTNYQSHLAEQLAKGDIEFGRFVEETQAIAIELGMTNRAKLEQVEAAQHKAMANQQRAGQAPKSFETVNLVSHGSVPEGIDKQLIAQLEGISNVNQLEEHVAQLKQRFYPDEHRAVAKSRTEQASNVTDIRALHLGELAIAA